MSEEESAPTLSMREMAARSGVSEGALRMWESRHEFPVPRRLPSGHRRYSELDLKRVRSVVEFRDQGLSLRTAIERARHLTEGPRPSVYAALRDGFPHLQPQLMSKRALLCLSRALEDELSLRAQRPILFGCFQHERFYRAVEPRWTELARTAERAIVLASFHCKRKRSAAAAEIPIRHADPMLREWVVVCESPRFAACLAGFELPIEIPGARRFETVWTFESAPVREAARVCCELAARQAPELVADVLERLEDPVPPTREDLRTAVELTTRMVLYAVHAAGG